MTLSLVLEQILTDWQDATGIEVFLVPQTMVYNYQS